MKLIALMALVALISCNESVKKETMSMPGAYTMLAQTQNDGKKDTTFANSKQLKIFTADHMMYANMNPADSVSAFGVGAYSADSGTVTENIVYSARDTSINSMTASYKLLIEKTATGYNQIIPEITGRDGKKYKLTEAYESAGKGVKSPLDGVWKEVKAFRVRGKDTTARTAVQYKAYYAGYFMFGHTFTDSLKKVHTGIGYGTFEMTGNTKAKENVLVSTYYEIRGKSFDIEIEMTGNDAFRQILTDADGTKGIEYYERMKK